jgi:O-antigen ligase
LVLLLPVFAGLAILFTGTTGVTQALGRQENLTGRTEIWPAVLSMQPNALVGAGFESFWLSPDVHAKLWAMYPGLPFNEAHNGYIEVYLQLGCVGLGILCLLLVDGYRRCVNAFRIDPSLGGLTIAYILAALFYSVGEAGFRMLDPMWILLLFVIIQATIITVGVRARKPVPISVSLNSGYRRPIGNRVHG